MKRMFLYSIMQVALPIHLTFPPLDPGIGSPDIFGSVNVDPLNVGNLFAGKFNVFDILGGLVVQSCQLSVVNERWYSVHMMICVI
jgi:hypothetical protein